MEPILIKEDYSFNGFKNPLYLTKYVENDSLALFSGDIITKSIDGIYTVNLPELYEIDREKQVVIKNYSENKGVLDILIHDGILEPSYHVVSSDYVDFHICTLTKKVLELYNQSKGVVEE